MASKCVAMDGEQHVTYRALASRQNQKSTINIVSPVVKVKFADQTAHVLRKASDIPMRRRFGSK